MCKSFHEESLELPSEASAVDGDPQEGLECLFFLLPEGGKEERGPDNISVFSLRKQA